MLSQFEEGKGAPRTTLKKRNEKETDRVKAEKKVINKRLKVLKLADRIDNVSEACRRCETSRNTFYRFKRRHQKDGLEGLKNQSSAPHKCSQTIPQAVADKIINLAFKQPQWGSARISNTFKSQSIPVSHTTVWKILKANGLKTKHDRLCKSPFDSNLL